MRPRSLLSVVALTAGLLSATAMGAIQLVPIQPSAPVPDLANPGYYTFTYSVGLAAGNSLKTGDFFDLVDFPQTNAVPVWSTTANSPSTLWNLFSFDGTTTPAGSVTYVSGQAFIPTFAGYSQVAIDNPNIDDLVFQYVGADTLTSGATTLILGQWSIDSALPGLSLSNSAIVGADHQGSIAGQNTDPYIPPGAVPEPATAALLALGATTLLLRRRLP